MRRNFRVLETFRFIAAIFVALGHLFFWNQNFNTIPRSFILSVEFFFVLSGFILTLKLEKETLRVDEYLNKLLEVDIVKDNKIQIQSEEELNGYWEIIKDALI